MNHTYFNHRRNLRTLRYGFTLIELTVTIAIAAILLTIALPSFTGMLESNRVAAVTSQFMGAMTYARNEAVTRNQRVVVCTVADASIARPQCLTSGNVWTTGWIVFVDTNGDRKLDDVELLLRVFDSIPAGYSITNSDKAYWASFDTRGLSTFSTGKALTFTISPPSGTSNPRTKRVVISWTGRMQLTD